jgi:hypothetical protein
MLNYLKKFAVDIFPSVAATVIGAYIVNHYIVSKPSADAPAAAAASTANPKGDGKAEAKSDAKPAETTASVSNLPAAGVKARGISEKSIMEKTAAERPAVVEKAQGKTEAKTDEKAEAKVDAKSDTKSADAKSSDAKPDVKSAESPADADQRRQAAAPREKEKIRVILASPVQPVNSPAAPAVAAAPATPVVAAAPAAPVESAVATEERRDANDLARAAIERLRANSETSPRAPETARAHETTKGANAPVVVNAPVVANAPAAVNAPVLRPLPPPIMISGSPASEPHGQAPSQPRPPYAEAVDPNRPTPPAEIPLSRPLDLRAEVAEPSVRERATAAAEDALSTAKSIFHAVLPK